MGLSEDILKKGSGFLNSRESGSVRVDCDVVMPSSCEDVVVEISGIAEAESTHTCSTKESSSVQQMQDGRAQLEAEGDMLNLFDEDNAKLDRLPESIVDLQKKEKTATWAMRQATLEKRQTGQKKKSTKTANQEDTKRQPKAVLQQHCQKNGWEVPKYEKLFGRDNMYLYNVTIVRPNSGRGKNKTVGGLVTYSLPGEVSALESMEEAQNGVATWALFCLLPDLPLYHILVEPYRAMLLQWHAQGAKTVIDKDLENARRSTFVDSLVNAVAQDRSHASSDIAEPQKFPDKDSKAEWSPLSKSEITTLDAERCKSHIDAESLSLLQMFQEKTKQKKYKVMLESRSALPVSAIKGQLLHHLHDHEVVVVSGETGSGKTTQVPQYILEEMITNKQGSLCNIVCTQPRRLAAISIAERVAAEQGDEAPGSNGSLIGYQVRLDSAWNSATKLLFCTTGILLRRLAGDKDLKGVSHVIVDEVHERTVLGDFTLIILKDLVERRRGNGQSSLKIILMSATVDASIFSRYFGNCPVVMVKGRTFPVDTMYLEDIYEVLDYRLSSDSPAALSSSHTKTKKNFSQSLVNSSRGRQSLVQSGWGDEGTLEFEPCNPMFDEGIYHGYSERTQKNLSRLNEDIIDFDFLEEFISHIIQTGESGAILVFLPGITDIYSLVDRLAASKYFCNDASEWLIPLHSSVSNVEQRKVFQTAPVGVRKVVVATNIAETSITIDDVVHVIDCGKHKEMQFDPRRGMSRMVEAWISQANVKQRRGRAGRVRHGHCYCLYTRHRFEKLMRPFQVPEILRVPLVELCLQIKYLSLGNIASFLQKAIEPPKADAIDTAIATLNEVGALDGQEQLTALGYHLAKLPVDVHIGKMMLFGAVLGCLSPVLTVAACLSHRSPFSAPREQRDAAERAKRAFVTAKETSDKYPSISRGQQSDHLAVVAAYNSWISVSKKWGSKAAYEHCKSNFLNASTLSLLRDMRSQFAILLADIGFIDLPKGSTTKTYGIVQLVDDPKQPFNCNAHLASVVKATLCAGLYPNVAKMDEESVKAATALGCRAGLTSKQKVHWTDGRQEVFIHPSSVNHNLSEFCHPFLVFHEKVKTSKVYIHDTTIISPYTLLLFGGVITVQHETGQVSVDGWLKMHAPAQTAVMFKELRMALDVVLQEVIKNPKGSIIGPSKEVVPSIVKLLLDEEKSQS